MRYRIKKILFISLIFLVFPGLSAAWQKDKTYQLTILHTNDHHGRFWHNEQGEYGLAAQKTLVDNIRREVAGQGGSVLLLSGGDINTGVPESDLQNAEPDFRGMSLLGYDAMAIGNHEFDNPLSVLRQQEQWATFPLLSANTYQISTGKRLFQPYAIFDPQGIKIVVIGLTTDDTVKVGNVEYLADIEFRSPAQEAGTLIKQLRQQEKPDVIIAVTHMGHYDDGNHGSNAPGDVELARALPKGELSLIVGGHSQDAVCMEQGQPNLKQIEHIPGAPCTPDYQNGTWIVQAKEWGKYVGRADFTFRNGEFKLVNYALIPVNLKKKITSADNKTSLVNYAQEIAPNPEMTQLLEPFQNQGQQKLMVNIGSVNGYLEGAREKVRFEQTNLARLLLASQMERTKADFAVMSGGGIRDSIPAGEITYRDVLKVQPFANTVVYIDMPGADVEKYLAVAANKTTNSGAYAQFANVSLIADGQGVSQIKIKGLPLDPNKSYRMATLNFNAAGGDGYPAISQRKGYVDTGFVDAEVLMEYIREHSPLDVKDYQPQGEIQYKQK